MGYIYKYTTINGRLYENLVNNTLWFSKRTEYNDPFEKKQPVIYEAIEKNMVSLHEFFVKYQTQFPDATKGAIGTVEEFLTGWKNDRQNIERFIKEHFELLANEIGICCFSTDPSNIQMHSFYANSHKGLALGFEEKDLFESVDRGMKVNYLSPGTYIPFLGEDWDISVSILGLLLSKSISWSYENEIRIIDIKGTPGLKKFKKDCLKEVIFGSEVSEYDLTTVQNLIINGGYKCNFKKCIINDLDYKLDIINI